MGNENNHPGGKNPRRKWKLPVYGREEKPASLFPAFCSSIILANNERRINVAWIVDQSSRRRCRGTYRCKCRRGCLHSESVTHARSTRFFPGRLSHCVLINATRAKGHRGLPFSEATIRNKADKNRQHEIGRGSANKHATLLDILARSSRPSRFSAPVSTSSSPSIRATVQWLSKIFGQSVDSVIVLLLFFEMEYVFGAGLVLIDRFLWSLHFAKKIGRDISWHI